MEKFDDLLNRYSERFSENFPLFLVMGMEEKELIEVLELCLETDLPFNPEIDPGKIC